jgi:hypothetical protein
MSFSCCSGDASGPLFRPQFVPPSVEQRQGIAETLADALPGVEHGQALCLERWDDLRFGAVVPSECFIMFHL